ncbi:MAG: hypothetical protein M0Z36_03245 [Thermaerobacter sp.]|nr:hypothetical protein [Thermaerobacter sp.]
MTELVQVIAAAGHVTVETVGAPEIVVVESDAQWVIAALADGRWAATDDAGLDPRRVEIFSTREAALYHQARGWAHACRERGHAWHDDRFGWQAETVHGTVADAAGYLGIPPARVRVLAQHGHVTGAVRVGTDWAIPLPPQVIEGSQDPVRRHLHGSPWDPPRSCTR